MNEFTPHTFVSLLALGMALAFLSADRYSKTSQALAAGLAFIGIGIWLNVTLVVDNLHPPRWSGLLGLPDAASIIMMLEWLLRVRRTVPVGAATNVKFGDRLLRIGQLCGVFYAIASLALPDARSQLFLRALQVPGALRSWQFWIFATPILVSLLLGTAAILLLLNRRPDRAETTRVIAFSIGAPFMAAGFILPIQAAAVSVLIGEIIFLIGSVHYHVLQGNRGAFMSRFLSPQVAAMVRDRGLESAMEQKSLEVTVVCCDIRGFTPYAQANAPTQVIQVLRDYYDAVGGVVAEFGATIKDFAGDGILILIGAPLPVPDQAQRGIEMARRIREIARDVVKRSSTATHRLGLGVGVATGQVAVGIIGSSSRLEYTAVGPAVNLSSRLCELAADGEILIDSRTGDLAGQAGLKARDPLPVKGYEEPVALFAVAA
ncbi:MAG TPA: adenylate/guanylate cyclase domain-containing protein [Nevskiaceae bacterium]|nr:adenylate/guanylate cyclase domain-containing protein [Nevskiaceae bacterium]